MTTEQTLAEQVGMTLAQARAIAEQGFELIDVGDLEGASRIFGGLVALNAKDVSARCALAATYAELKRFAEAEEEYDEALRLCPDHPVALAGRGEVRLKRGDARAAADLQQVLDVDREMKLPSTQRAKRILAVSGVVKAASAGI